MPSYYGKGDYGQGAYSQSSVHNLVGGLPPAVVFSAGLSIVGKDAVTGNLALSVVFSGSLNRVFNLAGNLAPAVTLSAKPFLSLDMSGGIAPQVVLGASLTAFRPIGGHFLPEIVLAAQLTSGPLWQPVEPCDEVIWQNRSGAMADTDATYTVHYNWTKPAVGLSVDVWGTEINTDLDGIDTAVWNVQAAQGNYLPLTGGTLTGSLTLAADPAAPLQPATKHYVDSLGIPIGENRIINGDMRIDQRNSGASGTASGYTVDRWKYVATQTAKGTWQRTTSASGLAGGGFGYYLSFLSSSAYVLLASDFFQFLQFIEADLVTDFAWGTAAAQPVTLSFMALSSLTGTFSGAISNDTGARTYLFTYSLPVADQWTKVVITVPGDTAGTWILQGNATSVAVHFDLGSGTTFRGSAGAWASANLIGVTGAVSVVAVNNANFYVTGVKLEVGSVATPFNRQSLAKSLADCQRYYQLGKGNGRFPASAANQFAENTLNFQIMRTVPTVTIGTADTTINMAASFPQIITNVGYANSARMSISSAAAGDCAIIGCPYALAAEL